MSEVLEKEVKYAGANITAIAAAETVVLASSEVTVPVHTCLVHIRAWGQMTSGVGTTGIIARLRRGSDVTGQVITEANSATLAAAAGGNEQVLIEATERRSNVAGVSYCLTVEQVAATDNGTFLQGVLDVEILTG